MSPIQEIDFILKAAHLSMCALAGEALVRESAGEDLSKSASAGTDAAEAAMAKSAAFYKSAAPDWLKELIEPAGYLGARDATGLAGGAVGGLGGLGLGAHVGRSLAKGTMTEPEDEAEKEKYRNRVRLAGLALGIPGAIGGAMLGQNLGLQAGSTDRVNEFVRGIDRQSVGRFLDRITPTVTWGD